MATAALLTRRLSALLLHPSVRRGSALETVRWMGALQAQDYESGLWAVGLRTRDATRAAVEQAIAQREIVRTWAMRGTWHLVPAADARWMQELLASRQLASIRQRSADFGLDEAAVRRARAAVEKALGGGKVLPRPELVRRLAEATPGADGQSGNHLLRRFGNEGLLCGAVPEGKEATFALRDEWITAAVDLDRDATLAERHFQSHGPATVNDFAWWTGLALGDARAGIAVAGKALVRVDVSGREQWAAAAAEPAPALAPVELLPGFDEHLLGYQDRTAVLDADFASAVCPGGNGVFRPTFVVRGKVGGLWKKKETAKQLVVEVSPRLPPTPALRRATEESARRLGAVLGKPAAVRFV